MPGGIQAPGKNLGENKQFSHWADATSLLSCQSTASLLAAFASWMLKPNMLRKGENCALWCAEEMLAVSLSLHSPYVAYDPKGQHELSGQYI